MLHHVTVQEKHAAVLPPFCPSVLKPGLDLCVCHLQGLCQGGTLGWRQVLLPVEAFLQLADLHPAEGGARFFPLGRRPVLIRVANTAGHREGWQGGCRRQEEDLWFWHISFKGFNFSLPKNQVRVISRVMVSKWGVKGFRINISQWAVSPLLGNGPCF